ncbi:MAG: hypothetical protein F7C81_00270 [Desulfurococcales archaeon]|nr:hypothetical protein [Desulfurococcales archaeon]
MSRIRVKLLPDNVAMEYVQALIEKELNAALNLAGRPRGVIGVINGPINVLGFYSPWVPGNSYRRITGGPVHSSRDDIVYLGVVETYPGTLESLLLDASRLGSCIGGDVKGGRIVGRGIEGVIGVTKMGHLGLYEVAASGLDSDAMIDCLRERYDSVTMVNASIEGLEGLAETYKASTWVRYPGADLPLKVTVRNERGFYASLSASMEGPYIAEARIEGDFYVAPPMEPFNIVVRLEGTQLNELVFYQIKLSWRNRAELAGVDYPDIDVLFDKLFELASRSISQE